MLKWFVEKNETHVTYKVEVHDDCHLPEGGVVLPGSAGHVLRLLPGLQGGEVIPRSHTQLEIRNSHETFHFVMIIYFGKYFDRVFIARPLA